MWKVNIQQRKTVYTYLYWQNKSLHKIGGRCSGLMVSALVSGSSIPDSSPGQQSVDQ